ncbi:MAG: protein kinase [Verrucomicrobia bacterium]|nr:protein kinase [Verrucomicrobiota bacterium]
MNGQKSCPKCGAALPGDAPEGLCPQCLVKGGLGDSQARTAPGTENENPKSKIHNPAAPPTPAELAPHFPQLEILELIGQGGMGIVYKARQPHLDRPVALKILTPEIGRDPTFAERFGREAKALARLNHPNIVGVFDFGQAGGYYYFLMEFVDGVNLRQLEQSRPLTPEEALSIVPKICEALQYAHDEGIVHRDIKPGNLLIDKKGRVKIADFGLAKLVGKTPADPALTQSHQMMGTPAYMAPEQMKRPAEVDHRADIYSLGVVFYEMLTGELPMGRFALPSEKVQVDIRLDDVVLKSLERDVERRYQHVSEVKTDVESISGMVEKLPPALRRAFGFEYRSKAELFGLPLVHITSGPDPTTGRARVAKGILAIGDKSRGVIALGGAAYGVLAFGGFAMGGLAVGGIGIGVLTFSGLGLALFLAYSAVAVAPFAFGGVAIGIYAAGGFALGVHASSGKTADPVVQELFSQWRIYRVWFWAGMISSMASMAASFGATAWARRKVFKEQSPTGGSPRAGIGLSLSQDEALRRVLHNPATGMLITGIIYWATIPLAFWLLLGPEANRSTATTTNILLSFGFMPLIVGLFMILGGIKMKRFESYRFAVAASILPIVVLALKLTGLMFKTLAIGPGDLVGAPMGLWALVVLTRRDVKRAFAVSEHGEAQTAHQRQGNERVKANAGTDLLASTPIKASVGEKAGPGPKTT